MLLARISLLLAGLVFSQTNQPVQTDINKFGGLNDTEAAAVLDNTHAQEALNVEANQAGTSIRKRKGYELSASLTLSTAPVLGAFRFTNASGDVIDLVCQDRYCAYSKNGTALVNFLSTATSGIRYWDFVNIDGSAYGANSNRDPIFKFTGTVMSFPVASTGSIVALLPSRMVVANLSGLPNRICYSKEGDLTNFTGGVEEADSFCDDLGSAGDQLTAIVFHEGLLYYFKTNSFGYCVVDNQYNTKCQQISDKIGCSDPVAALSTPEGLMWRSAEGTFWQLDQNGYRMISRPVSNLVRSQATGALRSHTETTEADWASGVQFETGTWNTTTIPASIFTSTIVFLDTSSSTFSQGTTTQIYVRNTPQDMQSGYVVGNSGFELAYTSGSMSGWTTENASGSHFAINNGGVCGGNSGGTMTSGGTYSAKAMRLANGSEYCMTPSVSSIGQGMLFQILKASDGSLLYQPDVTLPASGSCNLYSVDVSTQLVGMRIRYRYISGAEGSIGVHLLSSTFTATQLPDGKVYWGYSLTSVSPCTGAGKSADIDFFDPWYIKSSTYTSQCYDTAFSTPIWGSMDAGGSVPTSTSVKWYTSVSTSCGGTFDSYLSISTGTKIQSAQKRFIKYQQEFTTSISSISATISSTTLSAATTGEFRTQCIEPGSLISAWGVLSCAQTLTGNGSIVYYATSAASCATLPSTKPSTWVSPTQTNNITLSISTNAAMYLGFKDSVGSSTDSVQIDACSVFWTNGTLAPPSWAVYNQLENYIGWAVAIGTSSTNNYLLRRDLNLSEWFPWTLPVNAPFMLGQTLYFGSATSGKWYKFGSVDADEGANINSYWRSGDISSQNPYQERAPQRLSIIARNELAGSLNINWYNGRYSSGSYSISTSTTSTIPYVRSNYGLPLQSPSSFFSVKVGNNSKTHWEVLGIRLEQTEYPWRVLNP